jgi:hypothetical protein
VVFSVTSHAAGWSGAQVLATTLPVKDAAEQRAAAPRNKEQRTSIFMFFIR